MTIGLVPSVAGAQSAAEIIQKVDENLTKVDDQTYTAELEVLKEGQTVKKMSFEAKLKGLNKKLIRFTAPGDVKGMTVLTTEEGHMYVYLPSYKRIRRVAAHVRNQGFMGTDLSAEDMGAASLSVGWKSRIIKQTDKEWVLEVTAKPGNETTYSKLIVEVLKQYGGVSKIDYINGKGKVVKTQTRSEWKTFGPITLPTFFEVRDLQTGSITRMRFFDCRVNTAIPDSTFSKRALMRAH